MERTLQFIMPLLTWLSSSPQSIVLAPSPGTEFEHLGTSLPLEMIGLVIQLLDPEQPEELETLRSFSSASKMISSAAQAEIFHTICITHPRHTEQHRRKLWGSLTKTVNASAHLARYIRKLELPAILLGEARDVELLDKMTCLSSLKLTRMDPERYVFDSTFSESVNPAVPGTIFPRLTSLDVTGISGVPLSWLVASSKMEILRCTTSLVNDMHGIPTASRLVGLSLAISGYESRKSLRHSPRGTPHPLLQFLLFHRCKVGLLHIQPPSTSLQRDHLELARDVLRYSQMTMRHLWISCIDGIVEACASLFHTYSLSHELIAACLSIQKQQ